jgi:hypothetical protein
MEPSYYEEPEHRNNGTTCEEYENREYEHGELKQEGENMDNGAYKPHLPCCNNDEPCELNHMINHEVYEPEGYQNHEDQLVWEANGSEHEPGGLAYETNRVQGVLRYPSLDTVGGRHK